MNIHIYYTVISCISVTILSYSIFMIRFVIFINAMLWKIKIRSLMIWYAMLWQLIENTSAYRCLWRKVIDTTDRQHLIFLELIFSFRTRVRFSCVIKVAALNYNYFNYFFHQLRVGKLNWYCVNSRGTVNFVLFSKPVNCYCSQHKQYHLKTFQ